MLEGVGKTFASNIAFSYVTKLVPNILTRIVGTQNDISNTVLHSHNRNKDVQWSSLVKICCFYDSESVLLLLNHSAMHFNSGNKTMALCLGGCLSKWIEEKHSICNSAELEALYCILSTFLRVIWKSVSSAWPSSDFIPFIIHSLIHMKTNLQLYTVLRLVGFDM